MKTQITNYSHAVGEFNYNIQLTPEFRQGIFTDEKVQKLTRAYLVAKISELNLTLVALEFGPDHVHIFVANCKNYAPCQIIQFLKGFSSRMMKKIIGTFSECICGETNSGVKDIVAGVLAKQLPMLLSTTLKKVNQNI